MHFYSEDLTQQFVECHSGNKNPESNRSLYKFWSFCNKNVNEQQQIENAKDLDSAEKSMEKIENQKSSDNREVENNTNPNIYTLLLIAF